MHIVEREGEGGKRFRNGIQQLERTGIRRNSAEFPGIPSNSQRFQFQNSVPESDRL